MPAFAGVRGTGNWGTDERPKNFREMILWLNANGSAPLFALMSKMSKESLNDPEHSWWEETLDIIRLQTFFTTGFSTTDNTLTVVAKGLDLVPGDLLQVEMVEVAGYTNELVLVSSVTSDTVIVVKRGIAGSTAVPIANSVFLTKIGNSHEEGSSAPISSTRNPTKLYNLAQIFKTVVQISGTAEKTYARTGDAYTNDKKRKAFDHARDIEFNFLFGKRYEDTSGTLPRRYVGGVRSYLTTNVKIFTTTPTEDTLLDFLAPIFDFDGGAGDERIVLAGNGFLNTLNKLARNSSSTRINFDKVIDLYGMKLMEWIIPQGRFGVKTHPLLNRHGRYTNSAFILDPTGLIYRPLRDTMFTDNIQTKKEDIRMGQWFTEASLEVQHEKTMGYIGNFTLP